MITRFAPSPTGPLHLGHAYSALVGHKAAVGAGGRFLLRIEDLDQARSRPEFVKAIVEDLCWLGIDWTEEPLVQSQRGTVYDSAFSRLRESGLAYACFCTRSDIAAATSAPHGPLGALYPGTCRGLTDDPQRRSSTLHSWRLDATKATAIVGLPDWIEEGRVFQASRADLDDIILTRKDAPAAYHLACVVDDSASGVTMVTRGSDLRPSTPVQRLLQLLLGVPEPAYFHHQLIGHSNGTRLAKRDRAPALAAMRDAGVDGKALAEALLAGELPLGFRWIEG